MGFFKNKKETPEVQAHIEVTFKNGNVLKFDSQPLSRTKDTYKEFIEILKKEKYLSRSQAIIRCDDISMISYDKEVE